MLHGSMDGRGVFGRMDVCICTAESLCCPSETTTILLTGYTPIQKKKLNKKFLLKNVLVNVTEEIFGDAGERTWDWRLRQESGPNQDKTKIMGQMGQKRDCERRALRTDLVPCQSVPFPSLEIWDRGLVKCPWLWKVMTRNEFSSAAHSHLFERLCLYGKLF